MPGEFAWRPGPLRPPRATGPHEQLWTCTGAMGDLVSPVVVRPHRSRRRVHRRGRCHGHAERMAGLGYTLVTVCVFVSRRGCFRVRVCGTVRSVRQESPFGELGADTPDRAATRF